MSQTVPDYMVPAALVLLDAFPLNVNGKIDHQALPAVDFFSAERRAGRLPETKTEQVICAVIRTLFSSTLFVQRMILLWAATVFQPWH
ncbi:hypothetical protein P4S72_09900 [Vibrio sp. PP-XX7]